MAGHGPSGRPARWLAGAVAVALTIVLAACSAGQPRNSSGQLTAPATTDSFSLRVGDCLGKLETGTTDELPLVPCDAEHNWEAFAASELAGDDFPGNSALGEQVDKLCRDAFADFIGIKVDKSRYELTSLMPTKETWTQADDREVVCLVGRPGGGVTGTLKGIGK